MFVIIIQNLVTSIQLDNKNWLLQLISNVHHLEGHVKTPMLDVQEGISDQDCVLVPQQGSVVLEALVIVTCTTLFN